MEDCSQGDLYGDKKEICETEPVKAKAERSLTSVGALTFTHISKSWKTYLTKSKVEIENGKKNNQRLERYSLQARFANAV